MNKEADNDVSFDQNNGKDSEKVQVVEHSSGQSSLHGQIFSKNGKTELTLIFIDPKTPSILYLCDPHSSQPRWEICLN